MIKMSTVLLFFLLIVCEPALAQMKAQKDDMERAQRFSQAVAPAENIGNSIKCDETNCKEYWERAQVWLSKHSRLKIQTATDVMLETSKPTENEYDIRITREPIGNGNYEIKMSLDCIMGPWIIEMDMSKCLPEPSQVKKAFYYYVKNGTDLLPGLEKDFSLGKATREGWRPLYGIK